MIPFEDAIEIVKKNSRLLETENIDFMDTLNRVLAEDIISDMNMPPFDKSAMDGYACRREDIKNELEVIETIPAGIKPEKIIGENQCAKIMTGAVMPDGADCIIIVEEVEELSDNKIKFINDKTGTNICRIGEDVKTGDVLLTKGTKIKSKDIANLAMTGSVKPLVFKTPKLGIIATGDEIVEPEVKPAESQIRNTNSYQLLAQCKEFGVETNYYGIASDNEDSISNAINKAKNENDIIILTGGVSMGDFDLVPGLLKKNGFEIIFDKVAVQPGKPTVFGTCGDKFVFGLPGNPVSSYLIFELFVKTLLNEMTATKQRDEVIKMRLDKTISRKKAVRKSWIPVEVNKNGGVQKIEYHGSAHITSLSKAFGIVAVPVDTFELEKGTLVDVRQI